MLLEIDFLPVLSSLITGELASSRRISALDPSLADVTPETEFGNGALGTDSLDLLQLAGAVAEMFDLYSTGTEEYLVRYRKLEQWGEVVRVSTSKKADRLTFRTSGSTGSPKRCIHSLERLQAEAAEHALDLSACRRVLCMVPLHHIYGFIWGSLLAGALGIPVVDVRLWTPHRITAEAREGDLLIGVPASWQLLLRCIEDLPAGVFGVTSGAPCPEVLFRSVRDAGVDLREVYGSSETAGIGLRRYPDEPFRLLPMWQRDDPAFSPPDQLIWHTERTFSVGLRQDGAVQVTGKNVFPARVAEMLKSHPDVADGSVRLMRPEEGRHLKAFVVWQRPDFDRTEAERDLRHWLSTRLQPEELPGSFTFGRCLPLNEMGKVADWPA